LEKEDGRDDSESSSIILPKETWELRWVLELFRIMAE
jgi:hypothetical protein